jgi:uncharacterized OB-fold protein
MSENEQVDTIEAVQRWNPEIGEWRAAADEGRLLIKACGGCGRTHYYPRSLCPFCFSADTRWQESPGAGSIYSFAVEHRGSEPFVIAYITLDEGPTMMSNLVEPLEMQSLRIGARVALDREASQRCRAPLFRLAE